jgi:peptidoglycan/LPS O-acetylase OafA/YrhL
MIYEKHVPYSILALLQCMFQSWYLAADFQLYIVSLLVVYAVWRWPRLGYTALGILMALSTIIPFLLAYHTDAAPLLYPYPE